MPVAPLSPSLPLTTGESASPPASFSRTDSEFPSAGPVNAAPNDAPTPQPRSAIRFKSTALTRHGASAAFFLCLAGFSVLATVLRYHFGFPLDDSWIHQTVARNLVDYGVLGYLPGVHSSGSSSLLWTLILAAQYRFLPSLSPVLFSALVSGLLLGLIGAGLKRMSERDGFRPVDSWILALAPALSGNFLWFGLLGMEHVLFVALSIAAITLWFRGHGGRSWPTAGGATVLVGLLALTRPEGLFLAAVLACFRRRAGRTPGQAVGLLLGTAAATGISLRVNWIASHTLLPLTMKGRLWLYFGGAPMRLSTHVIFLRGWFPELLASWAYPGPSSGGPVKNLCLLGLALLAIASLSVAIGLLRQRGRNRTSALLAWMLFLTLLYTAVLPATGHGGRYQPLQVLLALPLVFLALKHGLAWAARSCGTSAGTARRLATGTVLLLMVPSTVISWAHWRLLAADGIDQIEEEHGAMGAWVKSSLPPAAVAGQQIAVFDIGRIGYGLHGSLVDLGGLTDRLYLPYLVQGRVPDYLRAHGVRYVILPSSPGNGSLFVRTLLSSSPAHFSLRPLKTVCFSPDRAAIVLHSTGAAMPCQTAYSIDFR